MKKGITYILLFLGVLLHAQTTYYVDDLAGKDANNGTSKTAPFKSIEKLNELNLKPGDSIFFKRGGQWSGNFFPKGSGAKNKRIVISSYGSGSAPVLDAKGNIGKNETASYTLRLFNQEYIDIRDLKIKNFASKETPRAFPLKNDVVYVNAPKMGLYIEGKDCGTLHDIQLLNLEICEVNGDMSTKNNGGVFAEITWNEDKSKRIKSNFDGLFVEGCYIHDVDRTGWSNVSVWDRRSLNSKWGENLETGKTDNWYPSENIIFRNNKFEKAGANALIVRVAKSPLVEHCFFTHNGLKGSGNASFPFNCDDALFQYNEASYTFYNTEADGWDHKADVDAGGFDSDWNCKNTIIQYNYSHHNGHGGLLICCDGGSKLSFNDGTIIRYNVFESNNHHIIRIAGTATNTKIYNNVFFAGEEHDSVQLLYHKSWGGFPDKTSYMNNIFYSLGKGNWIDFGKSTNNKFQSNTFYGTIKNEPEDSEKSKKNPLFKDELTSESKLKPYLRFLLKKESPEIDKGIEIERQPVKDFLGNPIKGKPDRGAFENSDN